MVTVKSPLKCMLLFWCQSTAQLQQSHDGHRHCKTKKSPSPPTLPPPPPPVSHFFPFWCISATRGQQTYKDNKLLCGQGEGVDAPTMVRHAPLCAAGEKKKTCWKAEQETDGGHDLSKPQTSLVARRLGQIRSLCIHQREAIWGRHQGGSCGCRFNSSMWKGESHTVSGSAEANVLKKAEKASTLAELASGSGSTLAALHSLQPCDCVWRRLLPLAKFRGFHGSLY